MTFFQHREVADNFGMGWRIRQNMQYALNSSTVGDYCPFNYAQLYSYHFWMKNMDPIKKSTGNQHPHRKSKKYRDSVKRKMGAYNRFIQLGVIAQGSMQYLSITFPDVVWKKFDSWVRTIRTGVSPSEQIVGTALRNSFYEFLVDCSKWSNVKKFIQDRLDFSRTKFIRLIA